MTRDKKDGIRAQLVRRAVRFPRILRRRDDKTVDDADSLDTLKGLLAAAAP